VTDAAKTDKGFICEETFEGAEGVVWRREKVEGICRIIK
jgi:hypothetical protein